MAALRRLGSSERTTDMVPPKTQAEVFAHFDRLNQDMRHFRTSNDICTPMGCVQEMVDSIDSIDPGFWKKRNLQILDSCCGNGNFHAYIQFKTSLKNLHFNEINKDRLRNVRSFFGQGINLAAEDFLSFGAIGSRYAGERFDLVVSNPPYAKFCGDKRASKNHNMSRAFIRKALEITKDDGYILFIVPDNWMSFSDRNVLPRLMSQYQFHHLNIHGAKKWFPKVGSSFTWFLLQKSPNRHRFMVENHYKKHDRVPARIDRGIDFIPLYYSDIVHSLLKKTIYADIPKYPVETTSDLHRTTKSGLISPTSDQSYPYRLIHTPKQTVWSARPHKYQDGWKVFLSLSDRYGAFVDNCGMTQSVAFVRCNSKAEANRMAREMNKPLYRAINNLTRYGNFNNIRILQRLPRLQHVQKLTKRESELVEHFATAA